MSEKSQTVGDFTFLLTDPDFIDIWDSCRKSVPDSPDIEFGGKLKSALKLETCTQMKQH